MNFKKIITVLFLIVTVSAGKNAFSVENPQPTLEGPFLDILIGKNLKGYVTTKDCDKCKIYRVKITPDTKVFVRSTEGQLSDFIMTKKKPVYVKYDVKKKKALVIGWL